MPPERPEEASASSKRHRRSRSLNFTAADEPVDSTDWPKPGTGRSRKHDREDNDTRLQSPSKRRKVKCDSEPPMCKNTSKIPKAKRKSLRKSVNHRKASRTSNHQKLKESVQTLEDNLKDAKQEHHLTENELKDKIKTLETQGADSTQAHQAAKQELEKELKNSKQQLKEANDHHELELAVSKQAHIDTTRKLEATEQELDRLRESFTFNTAELKRVRMICDEKSENLQKQNIVIETNRKELQSLAETCQTKDGQLEVKGANMAAMQLKLDEAEQKLIKVSHEREAALTVVDTNGYRNEQLVQRERKAKDTLKKERQEHKKSISSLNIENGQLQQQYSALQKTLEIQELEFNRTITRLQHDLQDALPQSQRFNFKLSDETVMQNFHKLESKIRRFVDDYARPVRDATEQDLKIMWPNWSPELRRFLSSPLACSLIFEGYIWEHLLARIFAPWSKLWNGELGPALETALSIAGDEAANAGFGSELDVDYQHWRSNSSSFVGRLTTINSQPDDFSSDVEAMVTDLARLCGHEVNDNMMADVMDIFTGARDFQIQLRMLKAAYSFRMCKAIQNGEQHKYGFYFDDRDMIDRSRSATARTHEDLSLVDFVMSPGLYKRGNNDGEGYEDGTWLVKMGVVCNAARLIPKPRPSSFADSVPVQTQDVLPSVEVKQEFEDHGLELRCHTDSMEDEIKTEVPVSGSTQTKNFEGPDPFNNRDSISAPTLTSGPPALELQNATQTRSSPTRNTYMVTRSQVSSRAAGNVPDGKASIKSENMHPHPVDKSSDQGHDTSAKKTKSGKGPRLDAKLDPTESIAID